VFREGVITALNTYVFIAFILSFHWLIKRSGCCDGLKISAMGTAALVIQFSA